MEKRLFRFITPFAVAAIALGFYMTWARWDYFQHALWLHIKIGLVLLLVIYHIQCGRFIKNFENQSQCRSGRFFRIFNELPVFILFAAVILAVVRPI